ncbi:hypothetical protein D3C71_1170650 [compost metagenome]
MVRFKLLVCQYRPEHLHGQVIFLDDPVMKFAVGHFPRSYQFITDTQQLQATDQISQLIQRIVRTFK